MKIAHIAPPGYNTPWTSGYRMFLAQYLESDARYKTDAVTSVRRGNFVMIDNGEAEGERIAFERVLIQALDIKADEIILPDSIRNHDETIELIKQNYKQVPPYMRAIVPHGRSADQWQHCYAEIHDMLEAKYRTICVPKYTEGFAEGRAGLLSWLHNVAKATQHYSVHMLGVAGHPQKEILIGNRYNVRGLDTGAAVAWSQWGADIDEERDERFSLMWEPLTDVRETMPEEEIEAREQADRNAQYMEGWANVYYSNT